MSEIFSNDYLGNKNNFTIMYRIFVNKRQTPSLIKLKELPRVLVQEVCRNDCSRCVVDAVTVKQEVALVLLAVVQSWRTHACSKHKKWRVFRHTCFCAVNEQKRELTLSVCDCKVNHLNLFYILCNGNVKFHKENSSVFNHFISKFGGWI